MKAMILASGTGSRLLPLTATAPKCLIDINGKTALGLQLEALQASHITDIIITTGMLGEKIEKYKTRVYLVNTGWTGGPYGLGHRIDIDYTRTIVRTAIEGSIEDEEFYQDSVFKFMVPRKVGDLPEEIFVPKNTWKNPELYDQKAQELRNHFEKAMQKYGLSLG